MTGCCRAGGSTQAALKDDKRMIFKAATEAQNAADWLMKTAPAGMIEERAAA